MTSDQIKKTMHGVVYLVGSRSLPNLVYTKGTKMQTHRKASDLNEK